MMKTSSKSKTRLSNPSPSNNNFSEKYLHYTRQKRFFTPKKDVLSTNNRSASKEHQSKKDITTKIDKQSFNLTHFAKANKININMEIKNLNIFGNTNNQTDSKKKKLHKKTISALGKHQKEIRQKQPKEITQSKKPKHGKTKSQQNIKLSPSDWGQLLAHHAKTKKNQSIQVISKYAFCNRKGSAVDRKDKINQDTYILIQNFMMKDRYLFGVCDGHGAHGHFVSEFVKEILPENIEYFFIKNKAIKKSNNNVIQSSIKDAFLKTAKDLEESDIDINFSGTTTCLLYLQENKLFCANLGDSRAVMYSRQGEQWQSKPLSVDHKAQDQRQACRIKMNGGRVFPYLDEDGQQMGPYRIWIRQKDIPGLAMTRSFGDYVASTVGVISEPEVACFQISKDDRFMVVASDGLWEFISNEEVMELVIPAFVRNNAEQAVNLLQKKAVEAWQREDENIDDITIVVIFFKYY